MTQPTLQKVEGNAGADAGAGGILFDQNSGDAYKLHTTGTGGATGTLIFSYVTKATGAVLNDNILTLQSGAVGIGTAAPGYLLDVNGNARATYLYLTGGGPALFMDNDVLAPDGAPFKRITANDGGGNWNLRAGGYYSSGLKYASAGNSYAGMVMNMEGQVGNISIQAGTVAAAAAGDLVTTKSLYLDGNGVLSWDTSKLYINASGNVGIGTTAPKSELDIGAGTTATGLTMGPDGSFVGFNTYFNAAWKYKANGYASFLRQDTTGMQFWTAANNAAGVDAAMTPGVRLLISPTGAATFYNGLRPPLRNGCRTWVCHS